MVLPEHLKLARTLSLSPSLTLTSLQQFCTTTSTPLSTILTPILPYLTLPTLLYLSTQPSCTSLFPSSATLSELIDFQRDWLVSGDCPKEIRDEYLFDVYGDGGDKKAWEGVAMKWPEGAKVVIDAMKQGGEGKVCGTLQESKKKLKKLSGGLLDKLDWSNVALGGGSVLSILTGKEDSPEFADGDLDLFLYGLEPAQLIPKIASIIEQVRSSIPPINKSFYYDAYYDDMDDEDLEYEWSAHNRGELLMIKGFNAMTLVPPMGVKNRNTVQIIFARNQTVVDAIGSFDIECCCVAFTGDKVVALPRAVRSLALGDFVKGVNFLDTRLSRKLDPSSATCSSRTVKYFSRGFSLALPPSAVKALEDEKIDFGKVFKMTEKFAKDERSKVKTEELKGLAGLLRRIHNSTKPGKTRIELHADYGPTSIPYWKVVDADNLRSWENGSIQHAFWEFNVKVARGMLELIGIADKSKLSKKIDPSYLSTWLVLYVASFDAELILGLKDPSKVEKIYFFDGVANIQYIYKLPRSVIPLAQEAEKRLKALTDSISAPSGSQPKKIKHESSFHLPDETSQASIVDALSRLTLVALPPDALPPAKVNGQEMIPESLPGTFRHSKSADFFARGTDIFPPGHGGKLIGPLLDKNGGEEAVCKKSETLDYQVTTLAGLLQFRGIDEEIDRVKDLVWQSWCITARASVSLPQEPPMFYSMEEEGFTLDQLSALKRYAEQASAKDVVKRMDEELKRLEWIVKVEEKRRTERSLVGEWDGDRKRWLREWVASEDMV